MGDKKGLQENKKAPSKNSMFPAGRGGAVGADGITVISAFEGYAFDAGMRAGDRITAINGQPVVGISVDKVCNVYIVCIMCAVWWYMRV